MGRKAHPHGSVKMLGEELRSGDFFVVGSGDDTFHPGTYFVLSINPVPRYNSYGTLTYYVNMMWVWTGEFCVRFSEMIVPADKVLTQCVRYFDVVHTHDT